MYRPPNCHETLFNQALEQIRSHLNNLETYNKHSRDILIHGDFNFPFLSFDGDHIKITGKCDKSDRIQAESLIQLADDFFLDQFIRKPTRGRNILDLVFCNNHFLIRDYGIIVNSALSDHYIIRIDLSLEDKTATRKPQSKQNLSSTKLPEFDYFQCDEEDEVRIKTLLRKINWEDKFYGLSLHEKLETSYGIVEFNVGVIFTMRWSL